jgi:hypothetical protein
MTAAASGVNPADMKQATEQRIIGGIQIDLPALGSRRGAAFLH